MIAEHQCTAVRDDCTRGKEIFARADSEEERAIDMRMSKHAEIAEVQARTDGLVLPAIRTSCGPHLVSRVN